MESIGIFYCRPHSIDDIFIELGKNSLYAPVVYTLDFFQRIISGFYVFQLIKAFRYNFVK